MTISPAHHRLDHVDGLRAIAVGLVVWFHAQLPGTPQGYLGVDVFFVISGFLITGQIFDAVQRGQFSIADFYARRVVRILPPLFLVIACVLIAGSVLHILPSDTRRIALSAIASAAMIPNWYFLSKTDYFAPLAEREPLLHLWSLGVEEQYYLVAPAIAMLLGLWARKRNAGVYRLGLVLSAILLVITLAAALAWMKSKSLHVFYATPLRAWEFAAGACAILTMRMGVALPRAIAGLVAVAGVIAILAAALLPASTPALRFVLQVVAVAGSVAAITGCAFAPNGFASRLLSSRPMVGIGLVSYSFYLWHWPGLAFWQLTHLDPPSQMVSIMIGIVVPFVLAVVTYHAVEKPLRRWRQRMPLDGSKRRLIAQGIATSLVISAVAAGVVLWTYQLDRSPSYRAFADATALLMPDCRRGISDSVMPAGCRIGHEGDVRVVLWGDSHALSLSAAVADAAHAVHQSAHLEWSGGCSALANTALYVAGSVWTKCMARNDTLLRWLGDPKQDRVTGVVIGGAWGLYLGHPPPGLSRVETMTWLEQAMTTTLQHLQQLGLRVLVVGPAPAMPYPAPECLLLTGFDAQHITCGPTRAAVDQQLGDVSTALRRATERATNARFIDPVAAVCTDAICAASSGRLINYSDRAHLTDAGARLVLEHHRDAFAWVFGAARRSEN